MQGSSQGIYLTRANLNSWRKFHQLHVRPKEQENHTTLDEIIVSNYIPSACTTRTFPRSCKEVTQRPIHPAKAINKRLHLIKCVSISEKIFLGIFSKILTIVMLRVSFSELGAWRSSSLLEL